MKWILLLASTGMFSCLPNQDGTKERDEYQLRQDYPKAGNTTDTLNQAADSASQASPPVDTVTTDSIR